MANSSKFRNNIWKWLALTVIAAVSYTVTCPIKDKIRLGLDLKGGTSFTLSIDENDFRDQLIAKRPELQKMSKAEIDAEVEKALIDADERIVSVIRSRVDAMGTNEPVIQSIPKSHRIIVQLPGVDEEVSKAAKRRLQSAAMMEFKLVHRKNEELTENLMKLESAPEGFVKVEGGYRKADNFEEVSSKEGFYEQLKKWGTQNRPNCEFVLSKDESASGVFKPFFVETSPENTLSGTSIEKAVWARDPMTGEIKVDFQMNAEGAKKFGSITKRYKPNGTKNNSANGRRLAIILDRILISAPSINAEIHGRGEITGNFTVAEAQELASNLNCGSLPARLRMEAESRVAPTVGEDAIDSGITAAILGFMLVAIFMFIYYWYSGLVANVALFLDVVLLPAALVLCANVLGVFAGDPSMGGGGTMQLPVLTMPGIAGLVLSLGMAVDANVLIFERIREEFQKGSTAGKAISNGYGRAFTAIFDSNLTTIITGIILFTVGTGPVRGFAITLTAGVVISMFTAVVITRLIFDHSVNPNSTKPFKMLQALNNPKFDFLKFGKASLIGSTVVIVVSLAIFFYRAVTNPASVLAVDLTGGTSIVYELTDNDALRPKVGDIRAALSDFDNAAVIQYQENVGGDKTLLVKTGESAETKKGLTIANGDVGNYITSILVAKFPDAGLKAESVEEVGSMVGADLKKSGTKAVIFSLIAILIYVCFRFEFGFGLGGLVALAHDALITLGIFSLCGRQVSLIVVTALLTIIGYSINDTIVVFDRIREQLRHDKKTSLKDIANLAINSCLSRTVITSATTLFAVLSLFVFGDGSIYDFAFTMLIGIIAGTYSTVFIASPIMLWWYRGKRPEFEAEEKKSEN